MPVCGISLLYVIYLFIYIYYLYIYIYISRNINSLLVLVLNSYGRIVKTISREDKMI